MILGNSYIIAFYFHKIGCTRIETYMQSPHKECLNIFYNIFSAI